MVPKTASGCGPVVVPPFAPEVDPPPPEVDEAVVADASEPAELDAEDDPGASVQAANATTAPARRMALQSPDRSLIAR